MDEKDERLGAKRHIVDGEIIAEFDDETLMNLPPVAAARDESEQEPDEGVADRGRRTFFVRLALGGAAALAFGGGAALLLNRGKGQTVVVLPNGQESVGEGAPTDVSALVRRVTELEYQLATVTAERDQLITDLDSANREIERLQAEVDALQAECDEAHSLNSLWESLDAIGLDALVRAATIIVGNTLAGLLSVVGVLHTGLTAGRTVLNNFINAMPGPEDGIAWLKGQVSTLARNLNWLQEQVQEAVEPVSDFATLIGNFVLWVLDHLPFGIGAKARAGMEAMQTVVNSLPGLEDGVNAHVLDPLADWFGDDPRKNLAGILLNPIVEQVFEPAEATLQKAADLNETYQARLVQPVEKALEERAAIHDQIEAAQARLSSRRA